MSILSQGLQQRREKVDKTSLSYIFEEEPVDLTTFIKDSKYLNLPEIDLSPPQFQVIQAAERVLYADIYPKMGEEFGSDYWSADVPVKNLFTVMWGKGCLAAGQEVFSAKDGQWRAVETIQGAHKVAGIREVNADGDTNHVHGQAVFQNGKSLSSSTASEPFKRGHGKLVRVTTATGGTIDVYEGHLFASWESNDLPFKNRYKKAKPVWKAAGSLKPNDRIAVVSNLDVSDPIPQDPTEVELVGYWIGDGCMPTDTNKKLHFAIDSQAPDLLARYTELIEKFPGMTTRTETMKSGAYGVYAQKISGRFKDEFNGQSNPLFEVVKKYGLWNKKAFDKSIPESFFSLPEEQIKILLSALWDTDGSIYFKKHSSGKNPPFLEYCSVSEELVRDIQRLLLRIGVVGRVTSKKTSYTYKGEKREGKTAWRVTVGSAEYVHRLLSALSLHGHREEHRIKGLLHERTAVQRQDSEDIYWDSVKSVESIGEGDYFDMNVPDQGSYVAGSVGFLNSNSGKDAFARFTSLRIAHILLCMRNPQEYFKMPTMDSIHMLNVASNAPQAYRAFFKPMSDAVTRGWFRDKAHPTKGSIQYAKNLEAVSGHSDAEGQEGLNILLGVADEIDAFPVRNHGKNADGEREVSTSSDTILDMLRSSAATRFPETYKRIAISYPRYLGSPIMREIEKSKKSIKDNGNKTIHYLSGPLPTWEVNPRVSGPEHFAEHYKEDPNKAKAMYECKPQKASDPYFRNFEIFRAAINRESQPVTVDYQLETIHSKMVENSTSQAWVPKYSFAPDFQPVQGAMYALHADLALVGDRAGIAMSHVEKWQEVVVKVAGEDGEVFTQTKYLPEIKVDFVIPLEADLLATPAREIQIRWARELAGILIGKGFLVKRFTFDNFQSADSMQLLEMQGIETDRVSADRTDAVWKNLRDVASEGRLKMPYDELLMDELESLTKIKGKVDHLPHKSKDLADALACSIVGAIAIGGEEDADGKMVDLGEKFFDVGQAETPLYGYDDFELSPIGMNQEEHYGYF